MVSQTERFRKPTGHTLSEIVRLLQKKENQRLRFKDIQEKIGVSKPVLSNHLKKLEKEGTIVSIKEGREKYYMLSKNVFKILDRHVDIFSSNYSEFSVDSLMLRKYANLEELFYEYGQKMSAILFYTLLKSMETGQDWTKAIDMRQIIESATFLIPDFIDKENQPDELTDIISEMNFKNIKKIMDKIYKNKTKDNLKPLYALLEKNYPEEFEVMDYSYKKPQVNWAKHYTDVFERK